MARRQNIVPVTGEKESARDDYLSALKSYHALNDRSHDDPDLVQAREIMNLSYKIYKKVCFGVDYTDGLKPRT